MILRQHKSYEIKTEKTTSQPQVANPNLKSTLAEIEADINWLEKWKKIRCSSQFS